jgi:hypothetical protein
MPDFVEGFFNPVNDAMRLFDYGVTEVTGERVLICCARRVEGAV